VIALPSKSYRSLFERGSLGLLQWRFIATPVKGGPPTTVTSLVPDVRFKGLVPGTQASFACLHSNCRHKPVVGVGCIGYSALLYSAKNSCPKFDLLLPAVQNQCGWHPSQRQQTAGS
jgi:hypothetical protein